MKGLISPFQYFGVLRTLAMGLLYLAVYVAWGVATHTLEDKLFVGCGTLVLFMVVPTLVRDINSILPSSFRARGEANQEPDRDEAHSA